MRFVLIISVLALAALLWLSCTPKPTGHTPDPLKQVDRLQLDGL
ncbi:hypothetical protein [Desulfuromonas acetoxidans]|nr:hypothetical protein [Desulfuromonas acetoxidans]